MSPRAEAPQRQDTAGAAALGLTIDRDGEVPIGTQLVWALRSQIAARRFEPGHRLPGLRELAEQAGVNVNTARAVYQRLEQEGLVESQQGNGTFVASGRREFAQAGVIAARAARSARQAGVDPREVAAALYVASSSPSDAEQTKAARRALLRTQIASLEAALGEIEGLYPGLVLPADVEEPVAQPRLLNVNELEQVRASLVRRLATVQAAIDSLDSDDDDAPLARKAPARSRARKPTTRPAPAGA